MHAKGGADGTEGIQARGGRAWYARYEERTGGESRGENATPRATQAGRRVYRHAVGGHGMLGMG
ncbi:MAG: hypothetical protein ACFNYD_06170, partial [Bacteroides sp.]